MDENLNKAFLGHNGAPQPPRGPGRPKGSKNRRHAICENLMRDEEAEVTRAMIVAAKNGDVSAAKIILDRIAPIRKGSPVFFDLPPVLDAAGLGQAFDIVLRAISEGEITPESGASIAAILAARLKVIEVVDFAERLSAIERRVSQ
jgi:hypothetical protein